MLQQRLRFSLLPFLAAALLAPVAKAETTLPLEELLRATHIHGLAVDHADSNNLLIATHHGLYALNLDQGQVALLSQTQDDFMGFQPHPTEPGEFFASGHPRGGGNLGFIASTDGGHTWDMLSPGKGGPVDFHQMSVSKADPSVIYGVYGELQLSRDGGNTWNTVGPVPDGLIDLAASSLDWRRLYAATEQGLFISIDGGRAWQSAHPMPHPASLIETTMDGRIYAFMLGSGLISAQDPLRDWQTLNDDFGDRYLLHLAIDPQDPARLYASTQMNELLTSSDRGKTWQVVAAP